MEVAAISSAAAATVVADAAIVVTIWRSEAIVVSNDAASWPISSRCSMPGDAVRSPSATRSTASTKRRTGRTIERVTATPIASASSRARPATM